jgi:hypothetical protein
MWQVIGGVCAVPFLEEEEGELVRYSVGGGGFTGY